MAVLELEHLSKRYKEHLAVSDLSLTIEEGEIFGFVGPNGAGKTTAIKMILGLLRPDTGVVRIGGHDVSTDFEAAMASVGGIVENPDMYSHLSGYDNLLLHARARNIPLERIDEVLEMVGMRLRAKDLFRTYSLGMKQRLGLAQALLGSPKLLVLDEPTNGLDPAGIHDFRTLLQELAAKEHLTVLVSSHILQELQMLCTRVGIIQNGRLLRTASMEELTRSAEGSIYRYTLKPIDRAKELIAENLPGRLVTSTETTVDLLAEEDDLDTVNRRLMENGIVITGLSPVETSLEDNFLRLTRGGNDRA